MKTYIIFRGGIQQDCCWFRYRADATKRLKEHWRPNKEHISVEEFNSLDDVPPCDVWGGLHFERCANCWRKLKIDWLNHIKIKDMKKDSDFNPNVIDDSGSVRNVFDKETQKSIDEATKPLGK